MSWWKSLGKKALEVGLGLVLDEVPIAGDLLDLDDLVDVAENKFPGTGRGIEKNEFVIRTVSDLVTQLDTNDEVEFGVRDWSLFVEGIREGIAASVKIRNATNWFGKDSVN